MMRFIRRQRTIEISKAKYLAALKKSHVAIGRTGDDPLLFSPEKTMFAHGGATNMYHEQPVYGD
jgi:hypothetical protein